jgi:NAD+ kinase
VTSSQPYGPQEGDHLEAWAGADPTGQNWRTPSSVGLVLHPKRDCADAAAVIVAWATDHDMGILGISEEIQRFSGHGTPVSAEDLGRHADLLISLGGDGTMLRAMRLADGQRAPVLGVNLGKLGFLPEVDVPTLGKALSSLDARRFTIEPRLALDATVGGKVVTAFNDVVLVRVPGYDAAAVGVEVEGRSFVSYAGDAVIVATTTGSTAYSFSAGGPIVSPEVEAILVTPVAPHSTFNRGIVVSVHEDVALTILPGSGRLAVEVDGRIEGYVDPGQHFQVHPRPAAARVIRFGWLTFYERARRKLRITDSPELTVGDSVEVPDNSWDRRAATSPTDGPA